MCTKNGSENMYTDHLINCDWSQQTELPQTKIYISQLTEAYHVTEAYR